MRIDRDESDNISMTLNKEDLIKLKDFFDNHLMIPRFGYTTTYQKGTQIGTPVASTVYNPPISITTTGTYSQTLWQGIKSRYSNMNQQPPSKISSYPPEPEDPEGIFEKLTRALDLILQNKEVKNNAD